jgi:uncharacterized membrane protein YbhN (UPF0104 family)
MKHKKTRLQILWSAIRILVPIGLMGWIVTRVDWDKIWPLLDRIPVWMLVTSMVLFLLSQAVIALRWHFLLSFQGVRIPFLYLLGLVFMGAFASNFLPTTIGGDMVRALVAMKGQEKRTVAAASVIADRLYNLLGMTLLVPLILTLKGISWPALGKNTLLTASFAVSGSKWTKLQEKLQGIWQETRGWFTSPACILPALAFSWLSIGLAFGSFWTITVGLDIPISYWQASASALLAYFAALVPLAINGLGIQEGSLTVLLVLQGASLEQAAAAAILIRLVTMGSSLLGGIRLLLDGQHLFEQSRLGTASNGNQRGNSNGNAL